MSYRCKNCDKEIEEYTEGDDCPDCGFDDVEEN